MTMSESTPIDREAPVLVTGSRGMLGRALLRVLQDDGFFRGAALLK